MIKHYLLLFFAFATLTTVSAQNAMRREDKIKVIVNGDTLRSPWAGGLNTPLFSEADIDGDGHKDLVVFNRAIQASNTETNGYKLLTFKNNGTPNTVDYVHKPEWEAIFPPMMFWAKMDDIDCDDIPDLLSANLNQLPAFKWYKGMRDNDGMLYFEYRDTIKSTFYDVELQRSDFPGVGDINKDGDIDFITFNTNFSTFNYFYNVSVQTTGTCGDSVFYAIDEYCFGEIAAVDSGIVLNYNCPFKDDPVATGTGSNRHNGGSVLVIDLDADGDEDLIYSEVDKKTLYALYNTGDTSNAHIGLVDKQYPSYDVPARLSFYPLAFGLDVNNDGKKDILAAPSEPYHSMSKNSTLYYKNTSASDSIIIQLQQDDFLESDMIDLGQGAYPVLVDVNADSLIDLVVGNYGYFRDTLVKTGQLALFINVGTKEVPIFNLQNDDWLGLSDWYTVDSMILMALSPAFGDIDGDGDLDLFLGDTSGTITFFENTASIGNPMAFSAPQRRYFNIDVAGYGYSTPFVYDVNGDGLLDILSGNRFGNIRYFENRGTATSPMFDDVPTNSNFGGIFVKTIFAIAGYSRPFITTLDSTGTLYLLSGNEDGNILGYEFNPDSIYNGSFTQVFSRYSGIDAGERLNLAIADLTNDGKPEMLVGNHRGGLEFYTLSDTIENIIDGIADITPNWSLGLYPNPTNGDVNISFGGVKAGLAIQYSVTTLVGSKVLTGEFVPDAEQWTSTLPFGQYPPGLYIVTISQSNQSQSLKLIKY